MAVWRVLLNLSVTLLPTNGVVGIDASGFDRSHASKHYTKRTKLTIQQLKVTLLVDTRSNAILDVHVTTTRKHDSKIAPSLIMRNIEEVDILLGDKGYDDQKIRALARETGVRPLIKHREFSSLHKAWNARLDTNLYGQRSQNETVNSRLKRKYGAFVRSRDWWKQFRELVIKCIVHNLERNLAISNEESDCP
ncbi:ISH9-type transposase [Haloferax larsenii JCM 13917]|nr:ISH9-type transposase [Haloferax larsenii JCM 13917]